MLQKDETAQDMPTPSFVVNRQLLHPRFENYKLNYAASPSLCRVLSYPVGQSPFSPVVTTCVTHKHTALSHWNYAYKNPSYHSHIYAVDAQGRIFWMDAARKSQKISMLFTIPMQSGSHAHVPPSLAFAGPWLIVADGSFSLYLFRITHIENATEMLPPQLTLQCPCTFVKAGFMVMEARESSIPAAGIEIIGSSVPSSNDPPGDQVEIHILRLLNNGTLCSICPPLLGAQVPWMAGFDQDERVFLIGNAPYTLRERNVSPSSAVSQPKSCTSDIMPLSYSWIQTPLSVVITIPVPAHDSIAVSLIPPQRLCISLHIGSEIITLCDADLFTSVIRAEKEWKWELVPANASSNPDGHDTKLVVTLIKVHAHTRWPHAWRMDDGVLESMDADVIRQYASHMAKFRGGSHGEEAEGVSDMDVEIGERIELNTRLLSLTGSNEDMANSVWDTHHRGDIASKMFLEMDEELDQGAGLCGYCTHVSLNVESPTLSSKMMHISKMGHQEWICPSLQGDVKRCALQHNVDGVVFEWGRGSGETSPGQVVQHVATLDAFHFIQSSKRDRRLMGFSGNLAYFWVVESSRRMYVYKSAVGGSSYSGQWVLDFNHVPDDHDGNDTGNNEVHGIQWVPPTGKSCSGGAGEENQGGGMLVVLMGTRILCYSLA